MCLVKVHDIPPKLIVNMDQNGLALVPCVGERTYARKGSREVLVTSKDDKQATIVLPSLSTTGDMLPMQVILEVKTKKFLPQSPIVILVRHKGWLLAHTENHLSNLRTTKQW